MKKLKIGLIGILLLSVLLWCLPPTVSGSGYAYAGEVSPGVSPGLSPTAPVTPEEPTVTPPPEPTTIVYTVTFDANKHGKNPPSIQVVAGGVAAPATPPLEKRWTFNCWCTDKKGKHPFDFKTPITSDITLYADWSLTKELTASVNRLLTPTPEPSDPPTKNLTETLLGDKPTNADKKSAVPVPAALQNVERTNPQATTGVTVKPTDEPTAEPEEPEVTIEAIYDEIVEVPTPEPPDMSKFKEIEIGDKSYRDSFPWVAIAGVVLLLGAVAVMIVIYKKKKEFWDEQ